jgi:myo-inositol-1(or 4)-monophosphatase
METTPTLPLLLPPPVDAGDTAVPAEVGRALDVVHTALDELRDGPLDRGGRTSHELKADGTPVTPTDVAVDQHLRTALAGAFPHHGVVSEELDATTGDEEWQWVVDPVDGTSNFAAGLPHWAVALALCHGGVPVLGVIDAPDLGHRWVAVRGGPCLRNGDPVHVRHGVGINDPDTAHLPIFASLGLLRRIQVPARVRLNPRVMGAVALEGALVADGVGVAAATTGARVWDVAAAAVLVESAGGSSVALGAPVFPLAPGLDHTAIRVPTAHGPSHTFLDELVHRLTPEGGSLLPRSGT